MCVGEEGRKAYHDDKYNHVLTRSEVYIAGDVSSFVDLDYLTDLIMQLGIEDLVELKTRVSLLIEEAEK